MVGVSGLMEEYRTGNLWVAGSNPAGTATSVGNLLTHSCLVRRDGGRGGLDRQGHRETVSKDTNPLAEFGSVTSSGSVSRTG